MRGWFCAGRNRAHQRSAPTKAGAAGHGPALPACGGIDAHGSRSTPCVDGFARAEIVRTNGPHLPKQEPPGMARRYQLAVELTSTVVDPRHAWMVLRGRQIVRTNGPHPPKQGPSGMARRYRLAVELTSTVVDPRHAWMVLRRRPNRAHQRSAPTKAGAAGHGPALPACGGIDEHGSRSTPCVDGLRGRRNRADQWSAPTKAGAAGHGPALPACGGIDEHGSRSTPCVDGFARAPKSCAPTVRTYQVCYKKTPRGCGALSAQPTAGDQPW